MGNAVARVNGDAYKILGTLGEGGHATVYEVLSHGDKRHLALKWVRGVRDAAQLERLQREIAVHRRLAHAHVLPLVDAEVRDCGADGADDGGGVSYRSNRSNRSSGGGAGAGAKEVLMLFPICAHGSLETLLQDAFEKGARHVHDEGFAHRDVTPANILLSSANPVTPVLTGFNALAPLRIWVRSAAEHAALCAEAAQRGSAAYRPPELWAGSSSSSFALDAVVLDGRTDVWQLGCTLYAMAFGPRSPFESARDGVQPLAIRAGRVRFPAHKTAAAGAPPPSCVGDERFSPAFTAFIKWLLIPDAARRPTLAEVRAQLEQLRAGGGASATTAVLSTWSIGSSLSLSLGGGAGGESDSTGPEGSGSPPPTQVLSFSKLASAEWASFAACEKTSRPGSPALSAHSSEDWGEFAAFARSSSTSALSGGTVVWSTDSAVMAVGAPAMAPPGDGRRRQRSRRHSIGATVAPSRQSAASLLAGSRRELELRRALSTRGRLLLTQALDSRASQ
ncbi:hypothetical protein PybrP1_001027 [[Pythium] brassicae (nom. inval.)]|nr:hypothetical protein PybrP1_001027 [[Pythium] brassicae (nom. inval.)]